MRDLMFGFLKINGYIEHQFKKASRLTSLAFLNTLQ